VIDVETQVNAEQRTVGTRVLEAGEARSTTIAQVYDTDLDDLWDACTSADRIRRWFLPVTGDLQLGGRYQLEGNAGGTITACDPPRSFAATWEYGDETTWIEVRLTPVDDDRTRFELEHFALVDNEKWAEFGPGAVGVGWDLGLLGLLLHLGGQDTVDPEAFAAWSMSDDGRRFVVLSSAAWRDASIAAGTDPDEARAAGDRTTAAYTGEAPGG
jgi:uncharacterized protein YndB with AHSA1/START domain